MRRPRRTLGGLLGAALCVVSSLGMSAGTRAEESWAFGPKPPTGGGARDYLIYELDPGDVIQDSVRLSNLGDTPLTFRVYARDATSASDGIGFSVGRFEDQPADAGGWFGLAEDAQQYTVPPQTSADIPFTLTVPTGALPGDHAAGVVAELVNVGAGGAGTDNPTVEVVSRIATRSYIRVSGELRPNLAIDQLQMSYPNGLFNTGATVTVTYALTNVGNVRLSPELKLVVKDIFGRTVGEAPLRNFRDVLPKGTVQLTETFPDVWPAGRLTAEVTAATYGGTPTTTSASASIWAVPWLLVIALGVIAALLIGWRVVVRRSSKR
jgi:hypothetical protein